MRCDPEKRPDTFSPGTYFLDRGSKGIWKRDFILDFWLWGLQRRMDARIRRRRTLA
jgi:hypothetical protein